MAATFTSAEWIGQNKHFDDVYLPGYVTNAFNLVMTIPPNPYSRVLDPNTTSVFDLLHACNFPAIDNITVRSPILKEDFFSEDPPHIVSAAWYCDTLPPLPLVFALSLGAAGQAWLDGYQSIIHWQKKDLRLPLWYLHYWLRMAAATCTQRQWIMARDWVDTHSGGLPSNDTIPPISTTLNKEIARLGWGTTLQGIAHHGCMVATDIADLLQDEWMCDRHIDSLCAGIQERITENTHLQKIFVGTLTFFSHLRCDDKMWQTYGSETRSFRHLWELGIKLEDRMIEQLYFPFHVNSNHYIAIFVDARIKRIYYGCSLGKKLARHDQHILTRWLRHHGFDDPVFAEMSHASQDDAFSCGCITLNTIEHAIFGDELWMPAQKHTYRVKKGLGLLRSHNKVSSIIVKATSQGLNVIVATDGHADDSEP
jgi:hypothetical protein